MEFQSNEAYEQTMAQKRAAAEEFKKRAFTPDVYMPKAGEQIQVQFIRGVNVKEATEGVWSHIVHMTSKKGDIYELTIPCINGNSNESMNCPLCKRGKKDAVNRFNQKCDESKATFVNPYVMINLNLKWDKDKEAWAPKTDMKDVDGKMTKVELEPVLSKFMNKSTRFKTNLAKFIEAQGGDITGKVITITGIYVDKKGNEIPTGKNQDKSYKFAINDMISPVDTSKFEIPDVTKFFQEKTEQEMDLFLNTGRWFEPKADKAEGDVIRGENPEKPVNNATQNPAPATTENKYSNIPGTTFVTRED